jgi:uncharacterized Zn finger protein
MNKCINEETHNFNVLDQTGTHLLILCSKCGVFLNKKIPEEMKEK